MTTEEFRKYTDPWRWRYHKLAIQWGKSYDQMKKWRNGTCRIPDDIAKKVINLGLPVPRKNPATPAKMTIQEFRELASKWSFPVLSKLLNIPKGTIHCYMCSNRNKTVSKLAEERIRILVAKYEAGENLANLFPNTKRNDLTLRNGKPYIPKAVSGTQKEESK